MTQYQRTSDSGFIIGVFDPQNNESPVVDGMFVDSHDLAIAKAGPDWDSILDPTNKKSIAYVLADKDRKRQAAKPQESKALKGFRQRRTERVKRAEIRRSTQLPPTAQIVDMLPSTTRGRVALASVPAAAIAYTNRDRIAEKGRSIKEKAGQASDVRRNRPASMYYDSGFGKAAEEILKAKEPRLEGESAQEYSDRMEAKKKVDVIPSTGAKKEAERTARTTAAKKAVSSSPPMPPSPMPPPSTPVFLSASETRRRAAAVAPKPDIPTTPDQPRPTAVTAKTTPAPAAKTTPAKTTPAAASPTPFEAAKNAVTNPPGVTSDAAAAVEAKKAANAQAANKKIADQVAAQLQSQPAAAPKTKKAKKNKAKTATVQPTQGPVGTNWKSLQEMRDSRTASRLNRKAERIKSRVPAHEAAHTARIALEEANTAAGRTPPSERVSRGGKSAWSGIKSVAGSGATNQALKNTAGVIAVGGALGASLKGGAGAVSSKRAARAAGNQPVYIGPPRKTLSEGQQLAVIGGIPAGAIGYSELSRRRRAAEQKRPDYAGLTKSMLDDVEKANPLRLFKRKPGTPTHPPVAQQDDTVAGKIARGNEKLNELSNEATRTVRNARAMSSDIRHILGGKYAPAQKGGMGLTTGQKVAAGGAAVGGLMLGRELAGPKPYPYQQQKV